MVHVVVIETVICMRAVVRLKTLEFRKIVTSVDVQGNDLKIIFKLGQI